MKLLDCQRTVLRHRQTALLNHIQIIILLHISLIHSFCELQTKFCRLILIFRVRTDTKPRCQRVIDINHISSIVITSLCVSRKLLHRNRIAAHLIHQMEYNRRLMWKKYCLPFCKILNRFHLSGLQKLLRESTHIYKLQQFLCRICKHRIWKIYRAIGKLRLRIGILTVDQHGIQKFCQPQVLISKLQCSVRRSMLLIISINLLHHCQKFFPCLRHRQSHLFYQILIAISNRICLYQTRDNIIMPIFIRLHIGIFKLIICFFQILFYRDTGISIKQKIRIITAPDNKNIWQFITNQRNF